MSPYPVTLRPAWVALLLLLTAGWSSPAAAQENVRDAPADSVRPGGGTPRYALTLDYERSDFMGEIAPWTFAYLQLSRRTPLGTVIARTNYARRFDRDGVQLELDAYPRVTEGVYAYLNAGVSDAPVFPDRRYGAELFTSFPFAMELSAGVRRLEFDSRDVTLYTGSLGKYTGRYWISLRPFVTPRDGDLSTSASVTVRRYFDGPQEYIAVVAGSGIRPDERVTVADLERLHSMRIEIEGRMPTFERFRLRWSVGYEREELPHQRERNRLRVGVGAETWF